MHPAHAKEEATRLRREGRSLREIAGALGVSLSTASLWVRDVQVPKPVSKAESPYLPEPLEAEELKICPRCMRILPEGAFNRLRKGRQGWCRDCFRTYFQDRGQLHRDQSQAAKRKRVIAARAMIEEQLRLYPCADCGIADSMVLEFDHIGVKRDHITKLSWNGASERMLRDELSNCDVVCVNCHRRRTAHRGGFWRVHLDFAQGLGRFDCGRGRNRQFVFDVLSSSNCFDCGLDDIVVLEFDHLYDKSAEISQLVCGGYALETLRTEIAKCAIRCANCHRRQTLLRSMPPARIELATTQGKNLPL